MWDMQDTEIQDVDPCDADPMLLSKAQCPSLWPC